MGYDLDRDEYEDTKSKWYNSISGEIFVILTGFGALFLGLGLGTGAALYPYYRFNKSPEIQNSNLIENPSKQEEFYVIDGKTAVTEVDGEPILDFLRKREKK